MVEIGIDTNDSDSIVELIRVAREKDADIISGTTSNDEYIIAQLVENSDAKIKIDIIRHTNVIHTRYFNEHGSCIEELFDSDK